MVHFVIFIYYRANAFGRGRGCVFESWNILYIFMRPIHVREKRVTMYVLILAVVQP